MRARIDRAAAFLRANAGLIGAGVVVLSLAGFAVRWIATNRGAPPPRKVMQFTVVNVQPGQPPRQPLPPPPPRMPPPKIVEQQTTRVNLKPTDMVAPPDPTHAPNPGGGGRLALAAEGEGPGDACGLSGNPGGRSLLGGGGLGDGSGEGVGEGGPGSRYGWYYAQMASELEDALRHVKRVTT